jgi:general secretion pathway protein G
MSVKPFSFARGFTLIELLVVIGIIGILAAATIAVLNPVTQIQKANDARRKSDLVQIQRALEVYYNDHGYYPPSGTDYFRIDVGGANATFGQAWLPYMAHIPNDPKGVQNVTSSEDNDWHYQYAQLDSGQGFCLYATLERKEKDPQICPANPGHGNRCPKIGTGLVPMSGINPHCGPTNDDPDQNCNFGVCSTNETP